MGNDFILVQPICKCYRFEHVYAFKKWKIVKSQCSQSYGPEIWSNMQEDGGWQFPFFLDTMSLLGYVRIYRALLMLLKEYVIYCVWSENLITVTSMGISYLLEGVENGTLDHHSVSTYKLSSDNDNGDVIVEPHLFIVGVCDWACANVPLVWRLYHSHSVRHIKRLCLPLFVLPVAVKLIWAFFDNVLFIT
jgi:hypothetical protein